VTLSTEVRRWAADAFASPPDDRRPRARGRRSLAYDLALTVVLLGMTVGGARHRVNWHEPSVALGAGVVMVLALPVRRRWPVLVFAVASLAGLVQWLAGVPARPQDFAFLIALFTVAAYEGRRWSLPALGVGLVGAGLAWFRLDPVVRTSPRLVATALAVLAVWMLGDSAGTRRAYLRGVEERAARLERERDAQARAAVAEERSRIAREMHDVVAHRVGVIIAQADGASAAFAARPDEARQALDVISETGRAALGELRRLLGVLRDDEAGAAAVAPQPGLGDIDRLVDDVRRSGLPVRLEMAGSGAGVDGAEGLAAYRVVQEGLTNVIRHAGSHVPTTVRVAVNADAVRVAVVNERGNGVGAAAAGVNGDSAGGAGHGLVGMRERVALFGGWVEAGPVGGGWRVEAVIPRGAGPGAP